jgi:hypothetical protein
LRIAQASRGVKPGRPAHHRDHGCALAIGHVHDLPEMLGIQGLLGLSFLRQFNYEIRSAEGRIVAPRIAT